MPELLLLDSPGRFVVAVEEVLPEGWTLRRSADPAALAEADAVVANCCDSTDVEITHSVPSLLLVDSAALGNTLQGPGREVLLHPFPLFELSAAVARLCSGGRVDEETATAAWLSFPWIPAHAEPVLKQAAAGQVPLVLVGEPGVGKENVAAALAALRGPDSEFCVVTAASDAAGLIAACERGVVYLPDIELRSHAEQEQLAVLLAVSGCGVVAGMAESPESLATDGRLVRALYYRVAGLTALLPPLREQPFCIPGLARAMLAAFENSGSAPLSLAASAAERLQAYAWPGNATELEVVLRRSRALLLCEPGGRRELEAEDIVFGVERAIRPTLQSIPAPTRVDPKSDGGKDLGEPLPLEQLLAHLAHDLRNPLTTLKTFSSIAPEDNELARLARGACDRLSDIVDTLVEYEGFSLPDPITADVAELFEHALIDRGAEARAAVHIDLPRGWRVEADLQQLCFSIDCMVDAVVETLPRGSAAMVTVSDEGAMVVDVPGGSGQLVALAGMTSGGGPPASWRLALARELSRRNGGDLGVTNTKDGSRLTWKLPRAVEDEVDDRQTGSSDS